MTHLLNYLLDEQTSLLKRPFAIFPRDGIIPLLAQISLIQDLDCNPFSKASNACDDGLQPPQLQS